jgi:hypothetical protein
LSHNELKHPFLRLSCVASFHIKLKRPFLPLSSAQGKGADGHQTGNRADHQNGFCTKNLLAWMCNADARRSLRDTYPVQYLTSFCEKAVDQRDAENLFSELAQQAGYKPSQLELEARARKIDWARQQAQNSERGYEGVGPKNGSSLYGLHKCARATTDVGEWWDDGTALDPRSEAYQAFLTAQGKRAIHDSQART